MLEQAKTRNSDEVAAGRVELRLASAEKVPFEDASLDKIFAVNSMQVWNDRDAGLREIRRVLAPGGSLALAFTPNSGPGKEGVVEALSDAGFNGPRLTDLEGCFCALASKPA